MATSSSGELEGIPPPRNHRIHLRILSPGQGVAESVEIHDVPLETSIGQLKERISLVAPSKPPAWQQRLIFAGRVLANDNAMLSEALDPACRNSHVLTIHMISRDPLNNTRPQPAVYPSSTSQIAQAVPPQPAAVPPVGTETRQEQAAPQPRQPSPFPQPQLGQQLPQIPPPQLFAGIPQLPHASGLPGIPAFGVGPFPFGLPPGVQLPLHPGIPGGPGVQQPQQGHSTRDNQANGHNEQAGPQAPQMLTQMHEMLRQQHEAMHRAALGGNQGYPQPNQPQIVQHRFHAHWNPQQPNQMQDGMTGQRGAAASTVPVPESQGQNSSDHSTTTASETTPQSQPQQTQAGPQHTDEGNPQQPSQTRQDVQAQTQPSNPQIRPPHQQHTQIRFQNTFRPFPHAAAAQGRMPFGAMPIPLFGNVPTSQQLAMNLANVQAQAQLMAVPQTLYLLSSPTGPQALLYHNGQQYSAQFSQGNAPTPTSTTLPGAATNIGLEAGAQQARPQGAAGAGPVDLPFPLIPQFGAAAAANNNAIAPAGANGAAAAAPDAAVANANAQGGQDLLAPMQPLLQHFWLLFRVLLFAYFFIGTDDGYRRPLVLLGIALAFMLFRALDGQGVLRQRVAGWWEGVVGLPPRAQGQVGQAGQGQGQGQAAQAQGLQGQRQGAAVDAAGQVPRVVEVGAPQPGQQQAAAMVENDQRLGAVRRRLRPLERAAALFVASLWPGVGENTVRARREREAEDREAQEAMQRRQQEQQMQIAEGGGEAQAAPAEGATGYPRSVPINVGGTQGATGSEVDGAAEVERRRRREQDDQEQQP